MANLFLDSARSYGSVPGDGQLVVDKWGSLRGGGSASSQEVSATDGRSGGPAILTHWGAGLTRVLGIGAGTLIAGCRWKGNTIPALSGGEGNIFTFIDGLTVLATLFIDAAGKLWVSNGIPVSLGDSGGWVTDITTLHYYEMKVLFGNMGSVTVKVDGVTRINATGINVSGSITSADTFQYGQASSTGSPTYFGCDFYLNDSTGLYNNDFLGDVNVDYAPVNGAGASQMSTISGSTPAATRWQGVSEVPPDDDVTYNALATGDKDTFTIDASAVPSTATILAVQAVARCASDLAGTNTNRVIARSGTTEAESGDQAAITTYQVPAYVAETDPATSAPWTRAAVLAMQVGLRKTA